MKVLMISTDRNIFKEGADVRNRMIEYGNLVDELHIVVFAMRKFQILNTKYQISKNIFIYPTNSHSKWFYFFDAYKAVRGILSESYKLKAKSWLITCQDPFECGLVGWLIARKSRIPLQLQIHTDFLNPYFIKGSLRNKIRVRLAKFLIPRASCVRAVSERIKNSLKTKSYKLKAVPVVLPVFVDVEKIRSAPIRVDLRKKYPQFDFIILMASRFTGEKNIPLAIDAIRKIVQKYPKTGLIVIGDGPEKKNIELQVTSYKLQDNVIIEGWSNDIVSYYKTADVFLITSDYEGYCRTAVEAEAAGCPVIMTDVGIAGEIIKDGENGIVVPPRNKDALIGAITGIRGWKIKLKALFFETPPGKEVYLDRYKKHWEACL